jgi:hypothetical protein
MNNYKKSILIFSLLGIVILNSISAQNREIKLNQIFKTIDIKIHLETIKKLQISDSVQKKFIIDTILLRPNECIPPVLFVLSSELFKLGYKDTAVFWFYVAQIRGVIDGNICNDKSAKFGVMSLINDFGPHIVNYASIDSDKFIKIVSSSINYIRNNNEEYERRWICLYGNWAFEEGFEDEIEKNGLIKAEEKWELIKNKTLDDFQNVIIDNYKKK